MELCQLERDELASRTVTKHKGRGIIQRATNKRIPHVPHCPASLPQSAVFAPCLLALSSHQEGKSQSFTTSRSPPSPLPVTKRRRTLSISEAVDQSPRALDQGQPSSPLVPGRTSQPTTTLSLPGPPIEEHDIDIETELVRENQSLQSSESHSGVVSCSGGAEMRNRDWRLGEDGVPDEGDL